MNFQSFSGTVTMITDFPTTPNDVGGCYQLFSVEDERGDMVNFVVAPDTYFVDHRVVRVGDRVTGFYDIDVPVPMIYPPQYAAVVMAKDAPGQNVTVDFFNRQLVNSDGDLRLNISRETKILLENGQVFNRNPANRFLIVVFGATTRSIPAQTTPSQIIVLC
ncbi:hypothetical protein [Sporosarcina sp. 6E9]|uniref:hypothetical protein n=1 Tax=Sporosarcina sp. 6E9 TaxID=2819235 RepID=UPI001B30B8C4|nr:hypothetical protein [Sporosarcina sp. 6E9]